MLAGGERLGDTLPFGFIQWVGIWLGRTHSLVGRES